MKFSQISRWLRFKYGDDLPLHRAADRGDIELARKLIAKVNVDQRDLHGVTPLMIAAERGFNDLVRLFLEAGADLELKDRVSAARDGGRTALQYACENGKTQTVELLIASGADPDCTDQSDQTPLNQAILTRRPGIVEVLLKHGANPDGAAKGFEPPIVTAARQNDVDTVVRLLDKGADPNRLGLNGLTALGECSSATCANVLLDQGAEVNLLDGTGSTPLLTQVVTRNLDVVRLLLDRAANPNAQDADGLTPLEKVALYPNTTIAEMLVAAGANVNIMVSRTKSLLDWVSSLASDRLKKKREELISSLRARGAKSALELGLPKSSQARTKEDRNLELATQFQDDGYADLRKAQTNGANFGLGTEQIIAHLKGWGKLCRFRITLASHDSVEIEFLSLPDVLDDFVEDVIKFCPDTVDEARALADASAKARSKSAGSNAKLPNVDDEVTIIRQHLEKTRRLTLWWD